MIQDLGEFNLADENILDDVQAITDAVMTTGQSLTELAIRFGVNLLVCWILVHFREFPAGLCRELLAVHSVAVRFSAVSRYPAT